MSLCPPQIPHDLSWDRTRAAAVGNSRLTAYAMTLTWLLDLVKSNFISDDELAVTVIICTWRRKFVALPSFLLVLLQLSESYFTGLSLILTGCTLGLF
jgi:hypothetical protein